MCPVCVFGYTSPLLFVFHLTQVLGLLVQRVLSYNFLVQLVLPVSIVIRLIFVVKVEITEKSLF